MRTLHATPLTPETYAPYGQVVAAGREDVKKIVANQGTATRWLRLVDVKNLRPESAYVDISVYRCVKRPDWPFRSILLEHHPFTTQMIVPMTASRYVVLVALGGAKMGDRPDVSTARAFIAQANQGITYAPGVWHHPLLALDKETDFVSLVHDDGTEGDCEIVNLREDEQFMIALE